MKFSSRSRSSYASQMINREWLQMDGGSQRLFPAASDVDDGAGHSLITAYAAQRADGEWSLMLVNATSMKHIGYALYLRTSRRTATTSFVEKSIKPSLARSNISGIPQP